MNLNNVVTLRAIPHALFDEFKDQGTELRTAVHRNVGGTTHLQASAAREAGTNGPLTLVYERYECAYGRFHREKFRAYDYPINIADQGEYQRDEKVLCIGMFADDPPYNPQSSFSTRWEQGKGYWVNEFFYVSYNVRPRGGASVISPFGDWEFGFLLRLQIRAYELAHAVQCRGHWQVEWDPAGDFRKKLEVA